MPLVTVNGIEGELHLNDGSHLVFAHDPYARPDVIPFPTGTTKGVE